MNILGIDIGSRNIKFALVSGGRLVSARTAETSFNPLESCTRFISETGADRVIATGYGRHLLEVHGDVETVTEIKAFARGARAVFPGCRSVIDIGGQDTKVICLDDAGNVRKFEMNDRCAAGTGKFLEMMAKTLGFTLQEFGARALEEDGSVQISSMCAVFAESEVISLISRGVGREFIAKAVFRAVAGRVCAMAKRLPLGDDIVFAGGCAHSPALRKEIERNLGRELVVGEMPELTGALGAALIAWQKFAKGK